MFYTPKFIIFAMMFWAIMTILSSTMEHHTGSDWQGDNVTTFQYLTDFKNITNKTDAQGTQTFVLFNVDYFKTWVDVFTWNFSFMQGTYAQLIRWIIFMPISVGLLAMFAYSLWISLRP